MQPPLPCSLLRARRFIRGPLGSQTGVGSSCHREPPRPPNPSHRRDRRGLKATSCPRPHPSRSPSWASPRSSVMPSHGETSPLRSPSRRPPSPTVSPAATSAAEPRPGRARRSPSVCRWSPTGRPGPITSSQAGRPRPGSHPRAGRADHRPSSGPSRAVSASTPSTVASATAVSSTALRRGVDILVACPGRLEDLIERRDVDLPTSARSCSTRPTGWPTWGFCPLSAALLDQTAARPSDLAVLGHARW